MLDGILNYIANKQPTTFVLENVPRLMGKKHRCYSQSRLWFAVSKPCKVSLASSGVPKLVSCASEENISMPLSATS